MSGKKIVGVRGMFGKGEKPCHENVGKANVGIRKMLVRQMAVREISSK